MSETGDRRPENGNGAAEFAEEIDEVERKAARTVDLGRSGFLISAAVFVLMIAQLLPWVGPHAGWQVLAGEGGTIPQLFAATSTGVGIFASALTLITRRWWLTWVCAVGGWFASVDGLLAIWSQQSTSASGSPGHGPGAGMIIAVIAMIFLAANWVKAAFSRL